jgi:outer membrane protein assembly factor BamE (lipoprotein component of BamABCDE complex)
MFRIAAFRRRLTPSRGPAFSGALIGAMIAVLTLTGACSPREEFNGARIDPERLDRVKLGNLSRDEVRKIMGTPSSSTVFSGPGTSDTWYYISRETKGYGFMDPEVTLQRVVAVDFDETGTVTGVREFGLEDGKDVSITGNVTKSEGGELNAYEQVKGKVEKLTKTKPEAVPAPVDAKPTAK